MIDNRFHILVKVGVVPQIKLGTMNGEESSQLKKKILYVVNKPMVVYRLKKRKKMITASLLELKSHFDTNTMPLVRRSDSGGWHGIYSEHEFQSVIPSRDNSQDTNECNEIDSPSFNGSDSPRTEHFRGSNVSVSNLPPATREVGVYCEDELQTQTSDSSNEFSSKRLKCKGSKGDDSEPMYPPLDIINVPSNCTSDLTIKHVESLYDESIRLQNALAKLSNMTGNIHRMLNSRGVLADNRGQNEVGGSSHYLPFLKTETPLETPSCKEFGVMLAQTIDKHREDALNKSGEQKFTSQELANINDIAEQDAIVQLEEELQQENKRLKTSLTELSRAMSALYSALVDSRREPKQNRTINEGPSVKADMLAATTTDDTESVTDDNMIMTKKDTLDEVRSNSPLLDNVYTNDDEITRKSLSSHVSSVMTELKTSSFIDGDGTSKHSNVDGVSALLQDRSSTRHRRMSELITPSENAPIYATTIELAELRLMKAMKREDDVSECTPKQEIYTTKKELCDAKEHLETLRMMIENTLYGGTSTEGCITDVPSLPVETEKLKIDGHSIQTNFTNDTQSLVNEFLDNDLIDDTSSTDDDYTDNDYHSKLGSRLGYCLSVIEKIESVELVDTPTDTDDDQSLCMRGDNELVVCATTECHNEKERGKSIPKLTPVDCESVDDDELHLGFNDPQLPPPVKNKREPEHCTNKITSSPKNDCATAKTLDTMSVVVDTMLVVTINKHRDDILRLLMHSSHRDLIVQRRDSNLRALAAANQLVYRSGGQKLLPHDLQRLLAKAEEDAGRLNNQLKFRAAPALW